MSEHPKEDAPGPNDFNDESPDPESDVRLSVLCDAMQEQNITRVKVRYEGSGDGGCIDFIEYAPGDILVPEWIDTTLHAFAEDYCPDGYEDNEGGYGTLTIYPFEGLAELEHYDRYEDSQEMDEPAVAPLPQELRERLAARGITSVSARFDGYGDSGQMEEITVEPESITLEGNLEDAAQDFLLGQLPGGWENNGGGWGDFTVDVRAGSVQRNAYWRVERDSEPQYTRWKWRL